MSTFLIVVQGLGLIGLGGALKPGSIPSSGVVTIEQSAMSTFRILKNLTFPQGGLPANNGELHDKLPKGLLGFLRKEDKLHQHYHVGTKEEQAMHRANFTADLLRLFRPCASCSKYERYGSANNGGFVMCQDAMEGVKAAYSFGTHGNDDWGAAVSREQNIPVYQFDCMHTGVPCSDGQGCLQAHFFPECLGLSEDNSKVFRSLADHLRRHTPLNGRPVPRGGDLLLKTDIEGKEWNAFADARLQDLRRMRQIVVAFHGLAHDEFHDQYLQTVHRILKAGFVVAHIHGNNHNPMALFGDGKFKVPDNLEVTFVNNFALPTAANASCRSTQTKLPADAASNPWNLDLPLPVLPDENDFIVPSHIRVVTCHWGCGIYAHALAIGPYILGGTVMLVWIAVLLFLVVKPSLPVLLKPGKKVSRPVPPTNYDASEEEDRQSSPDSAATDETSVLDDNDEIAHL